MKVFGEHYAHDPKSKHGGGPSIGTWVFWVMESVKNKDSKWEDWKYNEIIQKGSKELGGKMYEIYMIPENLILVFF